MYAPGHHWQTNNMTTTCPYCGVGCGVAVKCDSKKSVNRDGAKIEHKVTLSDLSGDIRHPANHGKLCVKGSHLLDTNDIEGRLLFPEVNGQRSSWDVALDAMSEKITDCLAKYGPDSVAFYLSGQLLTEDYYIANKLMKGFIGSANVDTNSRLCMSSAVAAYKRAFGADAVPCCYEDLEETELLVLVGSNAAWTHPVLFQRMQKALAKHPDRKLVVIDPRKTATSKVADLHLAIKPSTDAWIYNGLLNYLIANKHCDKAYIKAHTNNFDDVSEQVEKYTLAAVSQASEVPVGQLTEFYAMFANARSAISFYSMGINQSTSGVDKANSIINCHLASAKIGKVGSGPFSITGQPNAMGGREVGGLANMLAAHMDIENPVHNARVKQFWQAPHMVSKNGQKAVDMFDDMAAGKIKFIWIMGTNPVVSMPNRLKIEAALKRCDMVVVSDIVAHTDTLALANIALPASGWSEKDGTVTNSERCISRQRGLMPLPGQSKHDWQIIRDLALKLGHKSQFNYSHAYEIFDEHARLSGFENAGQRDFDISGLAGLDQQGFDTLTPIQWPVNQTHPEGKKRLFEEGRYFTENGKANFVVVHALLPQQVVSNEFPFVLNTGRMRDQWHTMTRTGKAQALVEHTQQAFVYMHPDDAKALDLNNNELIALTSRHNTHEAVVAPIHISDDLTSGQLFAPIHWSKTNTSHGGLTSLFTSANDPISGQPELKHAAVAIQKIRPKVAIALAIKKSCIDEHTQLAEYQVRINLGEFWLYHLAELAELSELTAPRTSQMSAIPTSMTKSNANQASQNKALAFAEKMIGVLTNAEENSLAKPITWLSNSQHGKHVKSQLGFQDHALVAYFVETDQAHSQALINSEFIRECFLQNPLDSAQKQHLLSATSPSEYQQGRLICSCFKVRKLTIEKAIEQGINTVDALGEKLKCGTNCGSCKSELASFIQASPTLSAIQIPIKVCLSPTQLTQHTAMEAVK